MATIDSIKQRIEQLSEGAFQVLCDAYLSREGYQNPVSLGTKSGTQKTTRGTPDTYFCLPDGKYVFAEYTTQRERLKEKILSDLEKCFDSQCTGINNDEITEIIYCHTSSNLNAGTDSILKQFCRDKGVQLTLIGIDLLADEINRKYPILAKEHLELSIDSEQIQLPSDFVKQYNSNALAAPLDTSFQFRKHELERLWEAFDKLDMVILTGTAGAGKTRLALEFAKKYQEKHASTVYVIHNHGLSIYDDLKLYFEQPGDYFIVVDDANQISQLHLIIEYINKKSIGYNVKILVTVRSYALNKVKEDIQAIVHYSEITIGAFSDDEISAIVKEHFGIINHEFLNRIVSIAEGNARIAIIAGKTAVDANRLRAISDATELYSEYYGKALSDAYLDDNLQLQVTAGVISFLGSIHLEHIDPLLDILSNYQVDSKTFNQCIYKLHEMELVDICRDKAVAVSDQCFANYLLKYVFIDKRTISLSVMLDSCFQAYRERTIQAVNTLLNLFQNPNVRDFTISAIKSVWAKWKTKPERQYWEWVKVFFLVNQEETLLFIKEKIDKSDYVEIPLEEIETDTRRSYYGDEEDIVFLLGGFANTPNIDTALDLFFAFYLKRPDLFHQFFQAIELNFGIKPTSGRNGYYPQIRLINHFAKHSNGWTNPYVRLLFFKTAEELLQVTFSPSEMDSRGHHIRLYSFSLPSNEQVITYRSMIWDMIQNFHLVADCKEAISKMLGIYGRGIEEKSHDTIKADALHICRLFRTVFSPDNVNDCILAEHIDSVFKLAGYNSEEMGDYLNSKKLRDYHLLMRAGARFGIENSKGKNGVSSEDIVDYLAKDCNSFDSFHQVFETYKECVLGNAKYIHTVGAGVNKAIKHLITDKTSCFKVSKMIIESCYIQGLDIKGITQLMFCYAEPSLVKSTIESAPENTISIWLFYYFYNLPTDCIDKENLNDLYQFFESEKNWGLSRTSYISLDFLSKYETIDSEVFIKVARLILAKKEHSPASVVSYFFLLLSSITYSTKEVITKFTSDHQLLEELYLFVCNHDDSVDSEGALLSELCTLRKDFARKYAEIVLRNKPSSSFNEPARTQSLFDCPSYIEIIDTMVDAYLCSPSTYFVHTPVLHSLIFVSEDRVIKSDEWIQHYISANDSNEEKMWLLFNEIAELPDKRKLKHIHYFISQNDNPEAFKRIPLLPSSSSWSGSAIPMYNGRIEYLKSLIPFLSGIRYLEHKKRVNDEIEAVQKMIESEEIEDLLRG